jgi:MinD superfamily P-loop ATPase
VRYLNENEIKQVTIISGKGGTGKSSIIAALASSLQDKAVLADADVDAADLYLIFEPERSESTDFYGLQKAVIDLELCSNCGICLETCRFNSITDDFVVIPTKCEGCAACFHMCPNSAINMIDTISGQYFISETRIGKMIHAKLNPGEESSGLLVAEVRKKAKQIAVQENKKLILIDGSPGIGCPVISSLVGVNMALIITEPTLSGYHDLSRVLELLKQFKIPGYIVINRFDINRELSKKIINDFELEYPVISKIPYNPIFVKAMIDKKTISEMKEDDTEVQMIQETLAKLSKFIVSMLSLDN